LKGKSAGLLHLLKEAWPFLRAQRALLLLGLGLMAINRLAGLVLPASTKFLVDNVIGKRQIRLLAPLALAIIAATAIQGVTSFTLTQLLSKAAQRMIATSAERSLQFAVALVYIAARRPTNFRSATKPQIVSTAVNGHAPASRA